MSSTNHVRGPVSVLVLAVVLGALPAAGELPVWQTPTEPVSESDGPVFLLPNDPETPVFEFWIGSLHGDVVTHAAIWPSGDVETAKMTGPDRLAPGEGRYTMRLEPSEIEGLLDKLAAASIFEMTTIDVERLLTGQRLPNGQRPSISDNIFIRVMVALDSYQATARDEPIDDFEHAIRIPSPHFYIKTYPHSQDIEALLLLDQAFGALTALTKDSRLRPVD